MTLATMAAVTGPDTWIAARIRAGRELRGWTQSELADRLGKTQTAVSYWESARRTPSVPDLLELADVLRVDPASFLPGRKERVVHAGVDAGDASGPARARLSAVLRA